MNNQIRIFVSQPMNGKTDGEIQLERWTAFDDAIHRLPHEMQLNGNYVLVDSYFKDYDPSEAKNAPLAYLGKSIELMATADVVYFCEGWQNARGCVIEHECATKYGMLIME